MGVRLLDRLDSAPAQHLVNNPACGPGAHPGTWCEMDAAKAPSPAPEPLSNGKSDTPLVWGFGDKVCVVTSFGINSERFEDPLVCPERVKQCRGCAEMT